MKSLSVIVITKNEERNIVECLESVRWAQEIVVVDGGSDDKTIELARGYTPKVYVKSWEGFGASKNFGLQQCTGDWILWLDADERVTDELSREIQAVVEEEQHASGMKSREKHSSWADGSNIAAGIRDMS